MLFPPARLQVHLHSQKQWKGFKAKEITESSNTEVSTACLTHPSNSKNLHQLSFFPTEQKQQPHILLFLDILLYLKVMWESESGSCSALSDSLWPHGLYTVHGILQARILEWVAFPLSRGSSQQKAVNLSPVPTSMTYKLQRSICAWSPVPWAAGGHDPGY